MMSLKKYGYIKDENSFTKRSDEHVWTFDRYDEGEVLSSYKGIEFSFRTDFSSIEVIGDSSEFNEWLYKYRPENINEII